MLALGGNVVPRTALIVGAVDDLVVNVGDVRHQPHLETSIREVPAQNVVHQRGSAMAQVRRAVHGGATEINADHARISQCEGFHALRGGVVEVQHSDKPTI